MTQRKIQYWVIPPQADAEFVAHMEQVLDLYQKPYDPDCPVVCMDEQPVQLVKETRPPMAATKNRPRRVDYEYERAGTAAAAVFLFSEPLAGWRQATARARRTKVDWALEVAGLLEGRYAECPKITLVCDHYCPTFSAPQQHLRVWGTRWRGRREQLHQWTAVEQVELENS